MLIREDLPPGLQLAQAIHAAVELQRKVETPPTVVVLGVEDEEELLAWADRFAGVEPVRREPAPKREEQRCAQQQEGHEL